MWESEIGNYGLFFALLCPAPKPQPLKTQKIRILKKWKKLLEISSFYTYVPKTTIIWGTDRQNLWSFWAIFCPFNPLTTRKFKSLKKLQKHLDMSSFYTCAPKITIKWYMLPKIWSVTDNFLSLWTTCCPFTPLLTPETKILKKCKKNLEILSFYTCVP